MAYFGYAINHPDQTETEKIVQKPLPVFFVDGTDQPSESISGDTSDHDTAQSRPNHIQKQPAPPHETDLVQSQQPHTQHDEGKSAAVVHTCLACQRKT